MNFIEDDPSDFLENLGASVKHSAENLGGHDKARGVRAERDVAGHQADVLKLLAELSVLLVAQRLQWRSVNDSLAIAEGHGDGVLGDSSFASGGVGGDENGLVALQAGDGDLLKGVEGEAVGLGHFAIEDRVG